MSFIYANTKQTCLVPCENGTSFTFVTPTGTFLAPSLPEANAQAASYACIQAYRQRLCFGALRRCCCVSEAFSETIQISGDSRTLEFEVLSGTLPNGLVMTAMEMAVLLSGTPTTAGNYTFQIRATDASGHYADASFTLSVIEITDSILPDFQVDVPYDYQLTALGGSGNFAWRLLAGDLPLGLQLSSTGLITGTPIAPGGDASFVVECVDLDCESDNEDVFPPDVVMTTNSKTTFVNGQIIDAHGNTAQTTPESVTQVSFTLIASNLILNETYEMGVTLYNTTTGVSTPRSYQITATETPMRLVDSIPAPPMGQAIQVMSPMIGFSAVSQTGCSKALDLPMT